MIDILSYFEPTTTHQAPRLRRLVCTQCGEKFCQRHPAQQFCNQSCLWESWHAADDAKTPRIEADPYLSALERIEDCEWTLGSRKPNQTTVGTTNLRIPVTDEDGKTVYRRVVELPDAVLRAYIAEQKKLWGVKESYVI